MIKIYPSVLQGQIRAVASKSHAQRLLFAASIPSSPTLVKNVPDCEDINTTLETLESFGCGLTRDSNGEVMVEPFVKTNPLAQLTFNFKRSATTSRFAIPLAAALGLQANCRASESLVKRQLIPLTSRLALRGIVFSSFSLPLTMQGRLLPGEYVFRGDEGSQFISALMLSLPILQSDSVIKLESPLADRSFIDLTVQVLHSFGIRITEVHGGFDGFIVPGRQYYESPGEIAAENDWGLASMWITAAASCARSGGWVRVTDLPEGSPQQYRDLMPLLSLLKQDFMDINIDCTRCPNLSTLFIALGAAKGATVRVCGCPQLKYKETDRFKTMADCLRLMGLDSEVTDDGMTVFSPAEGWSIPDDIVLDCKEDPWVFMSFALSSVLAEKPITLSDESCAAKIYGDFLKDLASLGGHYEIL